MRRKGGALVVILALVTAACGATTTDVGTTGSNQPRPDAIVPGSVGAYGLPFAAGTTVSIGMNGLHADNFAVVHGGGTQGDANFTGQATVLASIDLLAAGGTVVHPVAAGIVRAAERGCDVVVVDHGNGVWSEYVHVAVTAIAGTKVGTSDSLGTVQSLPGTGATPLPCGLSSTGTHVHLAFAQASSVSQAAFVPLAGWTLCGHVVDAAGDLAGLGTVGGPDFAVPECGAAAAARTPGTPAPSPTIATPAPSPCPNGVVASAPTTRLSFVFGPTGGEIAGSTAQAIAAIAERRLADYCVVGRVDSSPSHMTVDLPATPDLTAIRIVLGTTGQIWIVALPQSEYGNGSASGPYDAAIGGFLPTNEPPIADGSSGISITAEASGSALVRLSDQGSASLAAYRSAHAGDRIALLVDGRVLAVSEITSEIASGLWTLPASANGPGFDGRALALLSASGAYPIPIAENGFEPIAP